MLVSDLLLVRLLAKEGLHCPQLRSIEALFRAFDHNLPTFERTLTAEMDLERHPQGSNSGIVRRHLLPRQSVYGARSRPGVMADAASEPILMMAFAASTCTIPGRNAAASSGANNP
jgi:hypothetical protein